jgi:hypothetical protein
MKARQLFSAGMYGPDTLKVLFKAFDDAWEVMAPAITGEGYATEAARLRLANVILSLAHAEATDPEAIKNAALVILGVDAKN